MSELLSAAELEARGLLVFSGRSIVGELCYERPAWLYDPRVIKDSTLGAFTLVNGFATTSIYRCKIGRYGQIGEGVILGPPEHPMDWFSTHPFAFSSETYQPRMYRLPEFRALAPDGSEGYDFIESMPPWTYVGHEAYVGAGSFVKRGVRIGDGAVIGACSVVTHDIPPYAIALGTPARVKRLRFAEPIVERMLKLQWWRYDLAPVKHQVDFSKVEATLEFLERQQADGSLRPLQTTAYRLTPTARGFQSEPLDAPLYDGP